MTTLLRSIASPISRRNCFVSLLSISLLVMSGATASADSGCAQSTDAELYTLIDTLRTAGAAISIDGNDSDWSAFPSFPDAIDDLPGNPGQEIVSGSIAPLADRIKLFARTAGLPTQTDGAFAVALEMLGSPSLEVQILLNPVTDVHVVIFFNLQNQPILPPTITVGPGSAIAIAFGADFIEVDIPYSVLTPFFPDLGLSAQRSWVRGGIGSTTALGAPLDIGPGTTSFRLVPTPYDLDPALPATANVPRQLSLPLQGQWLISQGAFGPLSQSGGWAYDFAAIDTSFNVSSPPGSMNNLEYYSFGEPILAPDAGTVVQAIGTNPDVTPPTFDPLAPFNIVEIDIGVGLSVSMLHERQNSVSVNVNDNVTEGQQVAEVGNSGQSTSAHLHMEINEAGGPLSSSIRGIELTDVRVSLNPVANDPWSRECAVWEIRSGFMVESLPPAPAPTVPLSGPAGLVLLVTSLLACGAIEAHRRTRLTA